MVRPRPHLDLSWRERVWADISQRPFSPPEMVCIALFLGLSCVAAFYLGAYKLSTQTNDPELGRIVMIMGPVCAGHLLWFFLLAKALLFPRGPTHPRQSPPDLRVSGWQLLTPMPVKPHVLDNQAPSA